MKLDIADCGEKVRALISQHLIASGVIQWIEPITLFQDDFQAKIESQMGDEAVASSMEHAIKNILNVKMDENPVYYTSLFGKLQQILDKTKNDWHMVGWAENSTKCAQVEQRIYIFLVSKSASLREIFGAEVISRIKQVKESIIKLAKIHYS